jgi:glucose-6-phosphate 1-dehydrogenase
MEFCQGMTSKIIPVEAFDYVVFGGTGDLAARKLIPALYRRFSDGQIPEESRVIGSARSDLTDEAFREFASDALQEHIDGHEIDDNTLERFVAILHYVRVDAKSEDGWQDLADLLGQNGRIRAFYLAVGPSLFGDIADRLHQFGIINQKSRLVIEKPIGKDLQTAHDLNEVIGRHFSEHQIFRIDHYLGKETVQNLMSLRFANALYQPVWDSAYIDHVQITVAEDIGVEGRGEYYNRTGALRDMVQNHLLQLLCLVAMEPPASIDADAVRDEKLKVLRSLKPITPDSVKTLTVRGQYKEGAARGEAVPGYIDEIPETDSNKETFVAIKAEIENWRWAGVPFYMRTGKRLSSRESEIIVQFKPVPHNIFTDEGDHLTPNRLIIRLQPDEGVKQCIMIKDPGPGGMRLRQVALDMTFAERFSVRVPDSYERLLLDVIRGNQTLFMRRDEVEAAWSWIDPIVKGWEETQQAVARYTAGTWGPSAAIALIERDGRTWWEGDL